VNKCCSNAEHYSSYSRTTERYGVPVFDITMQTYTDYFWPFDTLAKIKGVT